MKMIAPLFHLKTLYFSNKDFLFISESKPVPPDAPSNFAEASPPRPPKIRLNYHNCAFYFITRKHSKPSPPRPPGPLLEHRPPTPPLNNIHVLMEIEDLFIYVLERTWTSLSSYIWKMIWASPSINTIFPILAATYFIKLSANFIYLYRLKNGNRLP
jgi:hypothetical protein